MCMQQRGTWFIWLPVSVLGACTLPTHSVRHTLTFAEADGGSYSRTAATFIQGRAGIGFSAGGPRANFGSIDKLVADDDPPGGVEEDPSDGGFSSLTRILVAFPDVVGPNPGQVPPHATIHRATLTLKTLDANYAEAIPPPLTVHQVLTGWDESTVTWESFHHGGVPGTDYVKSPVASFQPSHEDTYYTIDITSTVQRWVDGEAPLGLIIIRDHADVAAFFSDDHPSIENRPKLAAEFSAR